MGSKKLIIVGAALGVVLAGVVAFFVVANPFGQGAGVAEARAATEAHAAKPEAAKEFGPMYRTKERVVNLADRDARRYLKFEMAMEFAPEETAGPPLKGEAFKKVQAELTEELTNISPAIDDIITSILTSKTSADVVTSQGKELLREELHKRLGELVAPKHITKVYLTQFIIQ